MIYSLSAAPGNVSLCVCVCVCREKKLTFEKKKVIILGVISISQKGSRDLDSSILNTQRYVWARVLSHLHTDLLL